MYFSFLAIIFCVTVRSSCGIPIGELQTAKNVGLIDKTLPSIPNEDVGSLEEEIVSLKERITLLEATVGSKSLDCRKPSDYGLQYEHLSRNKRGTSVLELHIFTLYMRNKHDNTDFCARFNFAQHENKYFIQ